MKRSTKQLPSQEEQKKIALILGQNSVESLSVTKIVKEIKFEEIWGNWESKTGFQR